MRFLFLFIFTLSSILANSQTVFNTVNHDFGELQSNDLRFVDLQLTNNGSKETLIFSVRKSSEIDYIISKKRISPDSTSIIRFQVNPKKKGPFSYKVEIYTSDKNEATIITLKGNLQEVPQDKAYLFTSCPTFKEQPIGADKQQQNLTIFPLTVTTIDEETKETLSESTVTLIQKGEAIWAKQTDKKGIVKEDEASLGLSYFYATKEGYLPAELGTYINFKRNSVTLELAKDSSYNSNSITEQKPVFQPIKTPQLASKEINPVPNKTQKGPKQKNAIQNIPEPKIADNNLHKQPESNPTPPGLNTLDANNFDDQYFNPVNVVFILDISSSMRQADKIELMKYALMQLTEMLRPQDQFSMITYASQVTVQLKGVSGSKKELIKEKVKDLTAGGFTSGGTGIKTGFKTALATKINSGNNHVIVITDGAFNKESKDYKRQIKKYLKKGITLSIVGVKNNDKDEIEMRSISTLGGGRYVPIMKLSDAQQNLKQEIRVVSFKY